MSSYSCANENPNFFDSQESSRYNIEAIPYQTEHDNRFDDEPIVTVRHFDLSSIPDMPDYKIKNEDLIEIANASIKDHSGRFTIHRLNRLTENFNLYFREKGLLLARTYIPEQNIDNQAVKIAFVDGKIEEITTSTTITTKTVSKVYSHATLIRPFVRLINSPSYKEDLESAMIQLAEYPGLETETRFIPGDTKGTTKVNIQVKNEKKFDPYLNFDNYGSEYTGNYRIKVGSNINNLTGHADRLSLGLMATIDPTNSYYADLSYSIPLSAHFERDGNWNWLNPLFKHGLIFDTGLQQNTYSIGSDLEKLKIKGEATTFFYRLSKPLILNGDKKFNTRLRLDLKRAKSNQKSVTLAEDKLTVLSLNNTFSFTDNLYNRASSSISFNIEQGLKTTLGSLSNDDENSRLGQNGKYAAADFLKMKLEFNRIQQADSYQIFSKISYQHTDNMLVPLEQIALGGPFGVRGYTSSDYNADTAFQTTVEIVGESYAEKLSLPIDQLTAAVFVDYAIGWRNNTLANEEDNIHLLAAGWYADFIKEKKFQTRLQMGLPLSKAKPTNGNNIQFYLSMQRRF